MRVSGCTLLLPCFFCLHATLATQRQPPWTSTPFKTFLSLLASSTIGIHAPEAFASTRSDASIWVGMGTKKFQSGDVHKAVEMYNQAIDIYPPYKNYLWQRGLALYFDNDYKACSEQFRTDVALNPSDTEEAVWAMLCESHLEGLEAARHKLIRLQGEDSRPIMQIIYDAYDGKGQEALSTLAAQEDRGSAVYFYSNLYLSLLLEAEGDRESSRDCILRAVNSIYAKTRSDLMVSVADLQRKSLHQN